MRTAALAILAILALVLAAGISPLSNNDIWLHLTTGRLILERGEIPRIDDYSFTRAGAPYVAHEWLAQVIFALVFRVAGITGLIALKPIALGATAALVWLSCRQLGGSALASFWAAILAVAAMTSHLFTRPHLFTFVMLAATTWLLTRWRDGDRRTLVAIALLQALWANLHGGFVLGVALAVCAGAWLPAGVMALASLANPYGPGLYRFVLVFADPVFRRRIREWSGPFEEPFFGSFHFYIYLAVLLLGIAAAAHHARRMRPGAVVTFCLFAALSLASKRNASVLGVVAAPWIGLAASEAFGQTGLSRRFGGALRTRALEVSCAIVLVLAAGAAVFGVPHETGSARPFGLGVADNVPVAALDYITSHGIEGNALDSFAFGSYITWRAYPRSKVFIDSRLDVFGGPFIEEFSLAMAEPHRMSELTSRYRIDYALLSYRLDEVEGPALAFANGGDWALVYYDDLSLIYVRREARWASLIAADEYHHVNPYLFLTGRFLPIADPAGTLAEAERTLKLQPDSMVARLIKGTALQAAGRHREAVTVLEEAAARVGPDGAGRAILFGLLGTSYLESGDETRARIMFQRLNDLEPGSEFARRMLEHLDNDRQDRK